MNYNKRKRIPQNLLWFAMVKCCSVNISESAAFISSEMSALSDDWFYWFFVWEVRWDVWTVLIQQQRISKFAVLSGAGSIPPPPHHRTFLGDPPTWGCQHPSSGNNWEHELWDELCCQKHDTRFMFSEMLNDTTKIFYI